MQIQGLLLLRSGLTLSDESWEVVQKQARARGEFRRRLPLPLPWYAPPPPPTHIPSPNYHQHSSKGHSSGRWMVWAWSSCNSTVKHNLLFWQLWAAPSYEQGHLGIWLGEKWSKAYFIKSLGRIQKIMLEFLMIDVAVCIIMAYFPPVGNARWSCSWKVRGRAP